MTSRGQWRRVDRRVQPKIKTAPAVKDTAAKLLHSCINANVHRGERGLAALGLDRIVQFFQCAHGFANRNDVVGWGQCFGQCSPKAARRAGD